MGAEWEPIPNPDGQTTDVFVSPVAGYRRTVDSEPRPAFHWLHRKGSRPSGPVPSKVSRDLIFGDLDTDWCMGTFDIGPDGWSMSSRDPLDVNPSLLCLTCRRHGFIRNGRWEDCT